jgi:cerevisin
MSVHVPCLRRTCINHWACELSISGLSYVANQTKATGRPSVVLLTVGGSTNSALNSAVASLTAQGVHVVVTAGNSASDASSTSPCSAPSAVCVGSSNPADTVSPFSNYGPLLDIYAPGQDVVSAWIGSPTAIRTLSGTSAAAHVAGLVAYLVSVSARMDSQKTNCSECVRFMAIRVQQIWPRCFRISRRRMH